MENKKLFLSPPHMSGEEIEYINQALESNYIAPLGPMVDAFEREFAEYVGVQHWAAGHLKSLSFRLKDIL